jgi:hypothetical protein
MTSNTASNNPFQISVSRYKSQFTIPIGLEFFSEKFKCCTLWSIELEGIIRDTCPKNLKDLIRVREICLFLELQFHTVLGNGKFRKQGRWGDFFPQILNVIGVHDIFQT